MGHRFPAFFIVVVLIILSSIANAQHWTYGKGCAGLKLTWEGTARINTVLLCDLTSRMASTFGLVTFGWPWPCQRLSICAKDPICYACVFPVATRPILTGQMGNFSQPIGIPNDRSLVGLACACQFWLYNPPGDGCGKPGKVWYLVSSNPGWFIIQA
jgi:hypothetical protein